jgi:capsular polysaccharide transport system permease protein
MSDKDTPESEPLLLPPPPQRGILARLRGVDRLFVYAVVLPVALSVLYYGFIASDVFLSESRFVVRGPQQQSAGGLDALLSQATGASFGRSVEDSYSVAGFMTSRDALRRLDEELHLKEAFGSSQVDRLNRFAGFDWDDSFEALYLYYLNQVSVTADSTTPVSTLTVRAFTADDAYRINQRLLELSEDLVNRLNERGQSDMVRFAESVVRDAEQRARAASIAVSEYRHKQSVFDPGQQSALQLGQISSLQGELSAAKARMSQIRQLAKNNPQIVALQKMVEATQSEIDAQTGTVTEGQASLAGKAVEYEGLMLEQGLAEKQLETALASLVQARDEAQQKRLYLVRIVQPSKADVAQEPRRLRNVITTIILGFFAWGILSLLVAGVREHRD